jgi:transcriptional regulator with XRE-family HTH domain
MAPYSYIGLTIQILRQQRHLSAEQVAARMSQHRCPLTLAAYTEIEEGVSFPRDAGGFFKALTECLELAQREVELLIKLWAFAVLTEELGEVVARRSLGKLIPVQPRAS